MKTTLTLMFIGFFFAASVGTASHPPQNYLCTLNTDSGSLVYKIEFKEDETIQVFFSQSPEGEFIEIPDCTQKNFDPATTLHLQGHWGTDSNLELFHFFNCPADPRGEHSFSFNSDSKELSVAVNYRSGATWIGIGSCQPLDSE